MAYSGSYKGVRFRSLLELSVMRHFESIGLSLADDVEYETVSIPYGKTKRRRYIVDFHVPRLKMLVEVKPESRADNKNNWAKRQAATAWVAERGMSYLIVTDEILRKIGSPPVTLEEAAQIPDVVLGEKAARAMRRKEKKRKKR